VLVIAFALLYDEGKHLDGIPMADLVHPDHDRCKAALLAWAQGRGSLPTVYSASAARAVFIVLASNHQQAVEHLEQPQVSSEDAKNLFKAQERLEALMAWGPFMDPDDTRSTVLDDAWTLRFNKLMDRLSHGPAQANLRSLLADQPAGSLQEAMAFTVRDLAARQEKDYSAVVAARHQTRLRRAENLYPEGVGFSDAELAGLPEYFKQSIDEERERGGWESNWLPKGHPLLESMVGLFPDEASRETIWVQTQADTSRPEELQRLLVSRHRQCPSGSTSFAEQALSDHAEPDPAVVQKVLHGVIENLAPALARRAAAFQRIADRDFNGLSASKPWNQAAVLSAMYGAVPDSFPPREDLFPIPATLNRVVPDIFHAIGWTCAPAKLLEGGVFAFECARPDGQAICLLVRPALRDSDRFVDAGGMSSNLDHTWNAGEGALTGTIDLYIPADILHFTPEKLVHLAHEMGHILHKMSMPADAFYGDALFPADLIEFPSQLLERYVTADRLAAWVRPNASAHYRSATYWKSVEPAAAQIYQMEEALAEAVGASLDLDMHLPGASTIDATHNALRARAGLPPADRRTTEHRAAFMWQNDYAARGYTYLWSRLLIDRLLSENTRAETVAQCFKSFLAQVGSQAVQAPAVRRCWKQWQGETLQQSVTAGATQWVERLTVQSDTALALNPLSREVPARRRRMTP
jgi:hypothetical protein